MTVIFAFPSHWVTFGRVADVDPHAGQPGPATVLPVGDGDGGDDVGVQQVHSPPGLFLFCGVGTRPV